MHLLWQSFCHTESGPERALSCLPPPEKVVSFSFDTIYRRASKACTILHSWIIKWNPSEALEVQSTFAGGVKRAGLFTGVLGTGRGGGRWQGFKEAAIHVVWEGYKEPRDSSALKTYLRTCCSEGGREREKENECEL